MENMVYVASTFPVFTNQEFQRYSRHQMSFFDPLSTVPFVMMGMFLALTRACLFVETPFGINAYITAGVVFTVSNMIAFSFFLTCFIATKYFESHTAQYKYAAEVIKRHYAFTQNFSIITATLSTGFIAYGRVMAGRCEHPDDYYGNQICNPWAESKAMPMDSASFIYLLPFLVQVMFKTVRVEAAIISWLIATVFIVLSLQHVDGVARGMWYPVFATFVLFAAFEMERQQRIYYFFHNRVRMLQPRFLVNDIKREIRQSLGADLENIYHGLDTLLYTQDIIRLMSRSDVENLYNISVACNRLMKSYDQMIKIEDSVDDPHDGEGNEDLFGHVSLITRTAVTEARALLPSLRGPHSSRVQTVDNPGIKTTENASGGSEGTSAEWPRLQRTSSSRLPDPRSTSRVPEPTNVPNTSSSSIQNPLRSLVTFASPKDPSIDPSDAEVAQNTGGNNGIRSLAGYDIGGVFSAFEVAAIFPRNGKHV